MSPDDFTFSENRRYIPIRDGLVMGHISPDPDSLCSAIALTKMLRSKGKNAYAYAPKSSTPESLKWLIQENKVIIITDLNDTFCRTVRFLYVVDCEPSEARTGFPIDPYIHNWFNIDHHANRFKELPFNVKSDNLVPGSWSCHQDKMGNEYYFEMAGSTAGIMASNYGLKDDILAFGKYCDTLSFSLECMDCCKIVSGLDLTNERFHEMVTSSRIQLSRHEFNKIKQLRTWWMNDSSICLAYDPSNTFDKMQLISFLRPYCETLIVVSKNKNVSMRTNNIKLDLSALSVAYGGGGHKAASGIKLNDANDLFNIIQLMCKLTSARMLDVEESGALTGIIKEIKTYCIKEK